jgi:AcrR family transcriptional regulator
MSKRQVMKSEIAKPSPPTLPESKRAHILACAFDVVLRYGFQRMTMDDVAKACGMSRPALYLQFKNKGEIFSAMASDMMARALENAKAALHASGTIEERVFAAIKAGILDPIEALHSTAHGAELLDMKHQIAGDVLTEWRGKKVAMVADALEKANVTNAKGLSGMQLANILLDGIDGLKQRAKSAQETSDGARALVQLITS